MIPFGWHVWKGETGKRHRFRIALFRSDIPSDSGGIYVFVRRSWFFFLKPVYVGKAANLRERLWGHEKWEKAFFNAGATERHFKRVRTESDRQIIEEDLIRGLNPPMNTLLKTGARDDGPSQGRLRKKWLRRKRRAA